MKQKKYFLAVIFSFLFSVLFLSVELYAYKESDLKKLIKHDHDVIEMVTKSVNIANSCEHAHSAGSEKVDVIKFARQCQQMITSCRGFFNARSSILKGMKRT